MANEAAKRFDKGKKKNPVPKVVITNPASPQAPRPATTTQQTTPETTPAKPATRGEPQFHFQSPCDDPALVGRVWDRALEAPITLTQRELLAVSVDLRKRFKDHTTAKRVPVVSTTVNEAWFQQAVDDRGEIRAAVPSAPLRAVIGVLDEKREVECVIDNGSSIVALRKDIWEKLGTPIRSDLVMDMESSHSTVETTAGVLQNFPVWFGSSTFYLQIQVADNLPCELLLGRPFFMHVASTTLDHEDGSQELVLRNLNTGEEIMVPTHERKRKAVKKDF